MPLLSRQADCERPSRREDIQHGTARHRHSYAMMLQEQRSVFRLLSVLIPVRHWIRRPLCFVPWRRSISRHSRLLRLFGNTTSKKVTPSVGPEQEYFLVDAEKFLKRKDLIFTGRTLFGAMPPKGQELDDHYFGTIRQRIASYMKDVNEKLWKLGVTAKTQHNEVAPAQHELATDLR